MHEGPRGQAVRVVSGVDPGREPRCPTARELLAPRLPDPVPSPPPPAGVPGIGDPRNWSPDAQERALDLIRKAEIKPWRPFYCFKPNCDGNPHKEWNWQHARADQHPPPMSDLEWLCWLMAGGRGSGKTRAGSEAVHKIARKVPRIHLIAPTGPDFRDTMVEGESGLLATAPPDFMPEFEPSKKRLTWPNGSIAIGFSGEEPDRLRGPQCYWAWIDEPAHMPLIQDVWDNLLFGLRLGRHPRIVATTTPKPTKWMKALIADPSTRISRVSTYANLANLAETFKRTVLDRYEGTRLGKQELHGELLEDVEGALWNQTLIVYVDKMPDDLDRIVVGIDPAGTANKKSDETGIVVVGIKSQVLYVLADYTDKYSPSGWATAAVRAYEHFSADALVAEKNYGGDMVKEVLQKNGAENIRILTVTSRRGKAIRAEPIVALYEKGRVFHVKGATQSLEDEQVSWVPGESASPNRVDALVHASVELAKVAMPAQIATPSQLKGLRLPELASATR